MTSPHDPPSGKAEVLWDVWGVPHVFASAAAGLFRGLGWAQAHSHGDLLLRLYAQGRGRPPRTTARPSPPRTAAS